MGLVITAVTLWQVNSVRRSVDTYRARHLFAARAESYAKQLTKIHKEATKLVVPIDISIFLPLFVECKQVCYSIKEKIDDSKLDNSIAHNWYLRSLQAFESVLEEIQTKITNDFELDIKVLRVFLIHVASLANEIKQIEKDRKENI